jgi:hypothetical protein
LGHLCRGGAATALGGSHSLEAEIHYSGPVNTVLRGPGFQLQTFQLDGPDNVISFVHKLDEYAGVRMYTACSCERAVRGFSKRFASKLHFGENISGGAFNSFLTTYFAILASNNGEWKDPGVGFVGFRFQGSSGGVQYGWARVKMAGIDRQNAYKLLDYAFADPGEPIFAGQRSSEEQAPDQAVQEDSLGWLALGAAGLAALRKSRPRGAR